MDRSTVVLAVEEETDRRRPVVEVVDSHICVEVVVHNVLLRESKQVSWENIMVGTGNHAGSSTNVSFSERIIIAIADEEGVEPWDLNPPLFDILDPDALDGLFQSTRPHDDLGPSLTFSYYGYSVTVTEGEVILTDE